jgi:radical SAM superfamily enzyme YgiQ (UPF0313 family)
MFRPPAEANSALIQATIGCSWNRCAFCEMYTSKQFRKRPFEDVKTDIKALARYFEGTKKVFLADGNAFVLAPKFLIPILEEIKLQFGNIQRVSSYALPSDILAKTDEDLRDMRALGLKLLYIGIESGDDELLGLVNKGETFKSTVEGIQKAHKAGFDTSVMIINGLGGMLYSNQHAIESAKLVNEINPRFLSTLTLSLPFGQPHFEKRFAGQYQQQTIVELAKELKLFIEHLENINSIFRSDHISNNLVLKGILSRDKEQVLAQLDKSIRLIDETLYPESREIL